MKPEIKKVYPAPKDRPINYDLIGEITKGQKVKKPKKPKLEGSMMPIYDQLASTVIIPDGQATVVCKWCGSILNGRDE
jgi:hypothetical protein